MNWFPHQGTIDSKIRDKKSNPYRHRREDFARFKSNVYIPYQKRQMAISGIDRTALKRRVELLEDYYAKVGEFNQDGWIKSQSKFRSTILEEFCGYLFKDLHVLQTLGLSFFKKGTYAGIRIDGNGNAELETKNVDFCVGKEISATFADKRYKLKIPIVAIECKTYLDKTMLSEAQFTAQKLKGGTPRVKVFVVMETNQVKLTEIPTQTPIDQMYVLRRITANPIGPGTVWTLFDEIRNAIEHTSSREEIQLPGKLLA